MSKANRNHHKTPKDTSRDAVAPAPPPARPPGDPSSAGPSAGRVSAQAPAQRPTAAPPVRSVQTEAAPARAVRAAPATAPTRSGADAPAQAAPARAAPVAAVAPAPAAPAAPPTAPSAPQSAPAEVNGSAKDEKRGPAAKAPARAAKPAAKLKTGAEVDQPPGADRQTAPADADRPAPPSPAVRLAAYDVMAGERRAAAFPAEGELKGAAAVDFDAGSAPRITGELQAGGPLVVRYASNRSPYQHESAEGQAWGVQAFVEFKPGGERHTAPAIAFREEAGRLAGAPQSVPLLISVPKSATSVALFFKQWTGADRPQEVWDSNWGQNYVFEVKRS
jgi:hypothetical protein